MAPIPQAYRQAQHFSLFSSTALWQLLSCTSWRSVLRCLWEDHQTFHNQLQLPAGLAAVSHRNAEHIAAMCTACVLLQKLGPAEGPQDAGSNPAMVRHQRVLGVRAGMC
jgi:4'-phosphopantetheinyl transferase EntD